MEEDRRPFSVLDCLAATHGDSAEQCLRLARLCSRLAKLVRGSMREKLYRLKNDNISEALRRSPSRVQICSDMECFPGLLSVWLVGQPRVRVHTHENWFDAA